MSIGHHTRRLSRDRAPPVASLRKKGWASLQSATELCGRHANHTPEDLSKMARARVADFECDFDEAAGWFADELLSADDTLSRDELQRCHPRGLLEHAGAVEMAQLRQLSPRLQS